ncbi:hypothetical protein [Steroidobacter cummioxidans]|uniref:hypothetical protein n=1 Tax=Steroidobacter cummioxidans TaxID=1803913 RepID=UPI000E3112C3|nr:hypothetical protein [Steroidobacter cummioxidans]
MSQVLQIPLVKYVITTLNQLYEIESKLRVHGDPGNVTRNVQRIREEIEQNALLFYEDPMGERFDETRTDLEATISGEATDSLSVVEVIKPIIRAGTEATSRVIQKGIVVVRADAQAHQNSPSVPQ